MRSLELFAGCGGLALGLSRAGFEHALVVEKDADAIATLQANEEKRLAHVSNWIVSSEDVCDLNFQELGRVDLVSGGPPCQPFSIGGKHLGPRDHRNMWPQAIRAVRELAPRAFMFENVRGLLRPAFASYLEYITKQLEYPEIKLRSNETWKEHLRRLRQHQSSSKVSEPRYKVVAKAINTADYGAPQKRHRTLIVGVDTRYANWTFPPTTHSQESLVWAKHVSGHYWGRHGVRRIKEPASTTEEFILRKLREAGRKPVGRPWKTVRDALRGLPSSSRRKEPLQGHWQHPGARSYDQHTGSNWDEPAKALKAGDHGVPGGENMICNRVGNVRYFTIREMARLQCFPDNFAISGSWKAATRQLGNAVPTIIAERFGKQLLVAISRGRESKVRK